MITEPNWEAFERWGKAMTGGEYEQASQRLAVGKRRCAIGVAAELSGAIENNTVISGGSYITQLPQKTMEWLGIDHTNAYIYERITTIGGRSIWRANDAGWTFRDLGTRLLSQLAYEKERFREQYGLKEDEKKSVVKTVKSKLTNKKEEVSA